MQGSRGIRFPGTLDSDTTNLLSGRCFPDTDVPGRGPLSSLIFGGRTGSGNQAAIGAPYDGRDWPLDRQALQRDKGGRIPDSNPTHRSLLITPEVLNLDLAGG